MRVLAGRQINLKLLLMFLACAIGAPAFGEGLDEIILPNGCGISGAIISGGEVRYFQKGDLPLDKDSVFEIGSVTKVFTALAAAMYELEHPGFLETPIADYIKETKKYAVAGLTPRELANHTSGLSRLPPSFDAAHIMAYQVGKRPQAHPVERRRKEVGLFELRLSHFGSYAGKGYRPEI